MQFSYELMIVQLADSTSLLTLACAGVNLQLITSKTFMRSFQTLVTESSLESTLKWNKSVCKRLLNLGWLCDNLSLSQTFLSLFCYLESNWPRYYWLSHCWVNTSAFFDPIEFLFNFNSIERNFNGNWTEIEWKLRTDNENLVKGYWLLYNRMYSLYGIGTLNWAFIACPQFLFNFL